MSRNTFLGSSDLARVLCDLRMTCLDIGTRGGFTKDLLPLAQAVDAYGFDADAEECQRLNQSLAKGAHPWRRLRFIPTALGRDHGNRTLNLYRQRGCSSFFEADVTLAKNFSRGDYFILDGTTELSTMPLDAAAQKYNFTDAVYMKIDIEGAELEVFESGPRLLKEQLLAIRTEISFYPLLKGQPVFADIDRFLHNCGFVPMGIIEMHHWRRTTRDKHPYLSRGPIPYSRGQLIHGDMLYFRDLSMMADDTHQAIRVLIKAAFLALAYEYVDHAFAIFDRPAVRDYIRSTYGFEPEKVLRDVSRYQANQFRRNQLQRLWVNVKGWARRRMG